MMKHTLYKPEYDQLAYESAVKGAYKIQDLAILLDVQMQTVVNWRTRHPSFKRAAEKGKAEYLQKRAVSRIKKPANHGDYAKACRETTKWIDEHTGTNKKRRFELSGI